MAKRIELSDHAVLRYLEREKKIDLNAIRQEILSDTVLEAVKAGATGVQVGSVNLQITHRNGVAIITTSLSRKWRARKVNKARYRKKGE